MDKRVTNRIIGVIYNFFKEIITITVLFNISICSTLDKHGIIYIGEWTTPGLKFAYPDLKVGQHGFLSRNCSFVNCFYTTDHFYFNDIKTYDVILFNARDFCNGINSLPSVTENQQIIFLGFEPTTFCLIEDKKIIFDLTWTYKLTSDIVRPFFIIKNNRNEVIGPRKYMHWDYNLDQMSTLGTSILHKIKDKKYVAAIISSRCDPISEQQLFVQSLEMELNKFGQVLHSFGGCGQMQCELKYESGKRVPKCADLIRSDYYFFLAFEDALGEDYVTEKLLYALHNYAVPVVYGGANYTRFVLAVRFSFLFGWFQSCAYGPVRPVGHPHA